jgi:signal transduction histidine kinase
MILANLISNAIKYSPQNTSIHLAVLESRKETIIQIEDEGIGMSETEANKVFNRYFRGINNIGYGIGLAIVKQICDLYHIGINVKSEKGKGTKITLSLKNS